MSAWCLCRLSAAMMIRIPPSEPTCCLTRSSSLASDARQTEPSICTCGDSPCCRSPSHTMCTAPCATISARIASELHTRLCTALQPHSTSSALAACARSAASTSGTPPAACTWRFCISPHARLASAAQASCCTGTTSAWQSIACETRSAALDLPIATRTDESPQLRLEMAEQPSSCTTASATCASIASRMRPTPPAATTMLADSSKAMLASAAQPRRWMATWPT
mmetsp:Transcript_30148/g.82700  ORF Transcript_30148/g.82700 Transcript_30148/m.82700 type:complete len:224 (+) Transcript_30148:225-896(+)